MKIRYNNGVEVHVRPDLGRELVRAGLAVEIPPTGNLLERQREELHKRIQAGPQTDFTARWSIVVENRRCGTAFLDLPEIVTRVGGTVTRWFGHWKNCNARVEWQGGGRWLNGFGRPVPDEICEQYKRAWKRSKDFENLKQLVEPSRDEENHKMAEDLARKNRLDAQTTVPNFEAAPPADWAKD